MSTATTCSALAAVDLINLSVSNGGPFAGTNEIVSPGQELRPQHSGRPPRGGRIQK